MRRLLARWLIRRLWALGRDWHAYTKLLSPLQRDILLFDHLSLITTALALGASWLPRGREADLKARMLIYQIEGRAQRGR